MTAPLRLCGLNIFSGEVTMVTTDDSIPPIKENTPVEIPLKKWNTGLCLIICKSQACAQKYLMSMEYFRQNYCWTVLVLDCRILW